MHDFSGPAGNGNRHVEESWIVTAGGVEVADDMGMRCDHLIPSASRRRGPSRKQSSNSMLGLPCLEEDEWRDGSLNEACQLSFTGGKNM